MTASADVGARPLNLETAYPWLLEKRGWPPDVLHMVSDTKAAEIFRDKRIREMVMAQTAPREGCPRTSAGVHHFTVRFTLGGARYQLYLELDTGAESVRWC